MFIPGVCDLAVNAGKIFGNKEMRLLMLGLDAAGKTSGYFATATTAVYSRLVVVSIQLFSTSSS